MELGASTPSYWVWAQAANSPGHSGRQLLIIPWQLRRAGKGGLGISIRGGPEEPIH